jgi:hypothetical protein
MADVKISALPASTTPLAGTEVLPIVQSSTTKQVSVANLTAGRSVGGTNFIPSGSSAPTNGMFLPTANTLGFSTNSTERMRIDSSGNVGLGVTPACILDISGATGGQIKFPATQNASSDANTLDDYEEGTFTPILGTSNGGTATMSLQEGKYIKVGKIVQFSLQIAWTAKNTWSFNTRISGLPFTATTNTGGYVWPNACQMNANALTVLFIYGIESNSTIGYIQVINDASGAQLAETSFPASGRVVVNGCYQTT